MQMTNENAIVLSIKPRFAEAILNGTKTVELRRTEPKRLSTGGLVLLYATSPDRRFVGGFKVGEIRRERIDSLWRSVKGICSVSEDEFLDYYCGVEEGVALFVDEAWRLDRTVGIEAARRSFPGFAAPRSFRYATGDEVLALRAIPQLSVAEAL